MHVWHIVVIETKELPMTTTNRPPAPTVASVQKTARQFGQKVGGKEAKRIVAVLKGWRG